MSFAEWWTKLQELAFTAEHVLGEPEEYQDYFDDGDTPEDVLEDEIFRMEAKE